MRKIILPAIMAALFMASSAHGEILLNETFQSGETTGWTAGGSGDVRLSSYQGNVSLKLTGQSLAQREVSTKGYGAVSITLSFAAQGLRGVDACIGAVSADNGQNWTEILRVGNGQDDGLTLHSATGTAPGLDDNPNILIRLRAQAKDGGTCWADNIRVVGRSLAPIASAFDASGKRIMLKADDLLAANAPASLVPMDAFAPARDAVPATVRFEGRLAFTAEQASGFKLYRDDFGDAKTGNGAAKHLPPFDFAFVQVGDALVPEQRGAIPSSHLEWEYILDPGRVWREPGDGAYTRAAIPFTLEERNANCMHNGVLTFLFKADGSVSNVAYQIASETCLYMKFDAWGRFAARYTPGALTSANAIAAAYRDEIAHRLPVKPIAEITALGADASKFGAASEVDPDDMTAYGVVVNGTLYSGGCETRQGPYPFCDVLAMPSYSLAKSIFGGIGLMRLSALYPGAPQEMIASHVPQCNWPGVTFENALDMATGHYISPADQADEDAADVADFFNPDTHAGKIAFACNHYPRKQPPGERWVYRTSDTYILGTAITDLYRGKTGKDFYDDALVPLWQRLRLDPAMDVTRRTYDSTRQPFAGFGLTLHRDDIAKLADFLQRGGTIEGKAMLDPAMLAAALQRDVSDHGLQASNKDIRYNNGFWAWNAQGILGCKAPTWIPFMSGYGGLVVALFPNGMTYFYVSDSGAWRWAEAAAEANRLKPFCEK